MIKKLVLLLGFLLLISGCSENNQYIDKTFLGVIQTSAYEKNSKIIFFNQNLQVQSILDNNTASLGTNFNQPCYYENCIYVVPRGLINKYDDKVIVEMNMDTMKIHEYPINRINLQKVSVNDHYIATTSNLNFVNYISLINKKNGKLLETSTKNIIELIVFVNDKLYSFESNETNSIINVYSESLKLLDTIDISCIGSQHNKYAVFEDKIYFSNPYLNDSVNNTVSVLDTRTNNIYSQHLSDIYPSDIIVYNNDLIVAHTSDVEPYGTKVSILDKDSLEIKNVYDLKQKIMRVEIKESYLCVLSPQDNDRKSYLSIFDLNDNLKLVRQTKITTNKGYYYSTLFVN